MCEDAKLAMLGDTWNVLVTTLTNSGVSMTDVNVVGDVSFDLEFDTMFSDTSSPSVSSAKWLTLRNLWSPMLRVGVHRLQ